MTRKLEHWVKRHNTCPAFNKLLKDCDSDEEYYDRLSEPEYFLYGVSVRNPELCSAVIKKAILNSVELMENPESVKHVKKACQKNIPEETKSWFHHKKNARALSNLERAAHKFIQWKGGVKHGQFVGGIAVLLVRANLDMGVNDAKTKFMAYLKDSIPFEAWSVGLED